MELVPEVNRAFSAGGFRFYESWGAAPQAQDECRAFGANHFERRGFVLSRLVNLG